MTTPPLLPKARLEALTDGIFAVTMTLLVLDLRLPEHPGGLAQTLAGLLPRVDDYAISFAVLCVFWIAHVALLARVRAADRRFLWLNLAFLLFTTFVPPLTAFVDRSGGNAAAVLYGANLLAILACEASMWRRALAGLTDLPPDAAAQAWRKARRRFAVAGLTIAVAIALGLVEATLTDSNAFSPYVYLLVLAAGLMRPAFDPPRNDGSSPD